MNLHRLSTLLGPDNVSISREDRLVYSRDASGLAGKCLAVVWPSAIQQVSELVVWAGTEGVDLVPRGAGTGLCGGATPQNSVVVDMSRLILIGPVEVRHRRVQVGAGVVLDNLNRQLEPYDLFLPVIPGSHRVASIGGMIATDAAGLRAVRYGNMQAWVETVTLVDGLGQIHHFSGQQLEAAAGREGVTGFIVEAVLRVAPRPRQRSISLLAFDSDVALLAQCNQWLQSPHLTALEYFNRPASVAAGWEARAHLLAEFDSDRGEIVDPAHIVELWRARDGLYPILARNGFPVIEDPQLSDPGKLAALLTWLEAEGIPAFGHLGVGIVHPCFHPGDDRVDDLYKRVAEWGERVSGEHGIGLKKKSWTGAAERTAIQHHKAIYDPKNILNRGKIC